RERERDEGSKRTEETTAAGEEGEKEDGKGRSSFEAWRRITPLAWRWVVAPSSSSTQHRHPRLLLRLTFSIAKGEREREREREREIVLWMSLLCAVDSRNSSEQD
ncbi:hypothetical protein GW17_00056341, partial [Ensete ventricosum]